MIKHLFESLEDPDRSLMAPNCWFLKKIGVILPEHKLGKILCIIIHQIANIFVLTQYIELYVIRENLDLVLTNLTISMLSVICILKANTFVFWQKSWREVINYINEADKFERTTRDPAKTKIIKSYTNYCRRFTYFYWVLVFITFIAVVGQPLMLYISSPTFREDLRNDKVGFPHIYSSWVPVDKNHTPGCWITIVWHFLISIYGASMMAGYDAIVVVIMVFFGGKLDLLRERCKQMFGVKGDSITGQEAAAVIKELHTIHVMLIKHSRLFNSLLSPVMFLYVVMCSLMLCSSAYKLTSDSNNTAEKLSMAEYLVFGIAQLFVYCWHSNDVALKNENVIFGAYESEWWATSVELRKEMIILSGQLRISNIYSAGPFVNLTLASFITILKGAYSYYTLLRK